MAQMAIEGLPIHALQLSLITDPANGQAVRLVTQQDVTMLAVISRQLAASAAALDAVLSLNIGPAMVVSALDGTVLNANFAAQATLGFLPSSQAKVQKCFAIEAVYDSFRGAVLASGAGSLQLKMMAANGSPFWAAVSGARINYDRQDALVVLMTDINELYLMAAELENALDIERQTTEMQRRILAIAAHDLRTPLAIIDNTAQLLERKAGSEAPDFVQSRAPHPRVCPEHAAAS